MSLPPRTKARKLRSSPAGLPLSQANAELSAGIDGALAAEGSEKSADPQRRDACIAKLSSNRGPDGHSACSISDEPHASKRRVMREQKS